MRRTLMAKTKSKRKIPIRCRKVSQFSRYRQKDRTLPQGPDYFFARRHQVRPFCTFKQGGSQTRDYFLSRKRSGHRTALPRRFFW